MLKQEGDNVVGVIEGEEYNTKMGQTMDQSTLILLKEEHPTDAPRLMVIFITFIIATSAEMMVYVVEAVAISSRWNVEAGGVGVRAGDNVVGVVQGEEYDMNDGSDDISRC